MSCQGCKYWSEMLAFAEGGGPVQAVCLNQDCPHFCQYVHQGCEQRVAGPAIDDPRQPQESEEPDE